MYLFLHRTILTVFLFGVRGFATGFYQVIGLYTPEVCTYITRYMYGLIIYIRDGTIQGTGVSMHYPKSISIPQYITA